MYYQVYFSYSLVYVRVFVLSDVGQHDLSLSTRRSGVLHPGKILHPELRVQTRNSTSQSFFLPLFPVNQAAACTKLKPHLKDHVLLRSLFPFFSRIKPPGVNFFNPLYKCFNKNSAWYWSRKSFLEKKISRISENCGFLFLPSCRSFCLPSREISHFTYHFVIIRNPRLKSQFCNSILIACLKSQMWHYQQIKFCESERDFKGSNHLSCFVWEYSQRGESGSSLV